MNQRGFLGTNASVSADISLLAGIGVALLLTIGVGLALRKRYTTHRWVQTTAVTLNIVQVAVIMVGSFSKSAAPGIPAKLGERYYLIATVHGALGLATLLFGAFVALRGNGLVPRALQFNNYKLFMRSAYSLYMLVTLLGIGVYVTWYTGAPTAAAAGDGVEPVALRKGQLEVPMANFVFNPQAVVVEVGTTVVWVNQDGAPHTATADDGTAFKSELLSQGQRFEHTFDTVGEFPYFCELHGSAGGVDMAGTIKVVPAGQAPEQVAAAPSIAAPTPGPTAHPLPAQYFGQPVGTAAFRDAAGSGDQIVIGLQAAPPTDGQAATAFLTASSGVALPLGALVPDGGALRLTYSTPDGASLAGRYDRIVIAAEPQGSAATQPSGPLLFEGTLPAAAFAQLAPLLARDGQPGYSVALRQQTAELVRHAQLVAAAQAAGDDAALRRHAEHVFNLVAGSRDPQFGDRNGDGQAQNPGDGFGLVKNGDQAGYIGSMLDAALAARAAPDATDAVKAHATHVAICAENMFDWAAEARTLALQLTAATDPAAAKDDAARLVTLARWLQRGDDRNGDGEITPVPGEGGALVAYEHAQFMASFGLFPAK